MAYLSEPLHNLIVNKVNEDATDLFHNVFRNKDDKEAIREYVILVTCCTGVVLGCSHLRIFVLLGVSTNSFTMQRLINASVRRAPESLFLNTHYLGFSLS
jgi:hypothetical protein